MKNLILMTAIAGSACAQEAKPIFPLPYEHDLCVKGFYRYHQEGEYNYKTGGMGLEYNINPDEGFTFKISALTNLQEQNALVETENQIGYKFILNENYTIYPLLSTRFSSHHIGREDNSEAGIVMIKDVFVNKMSAFVGLGWEIIPEDFFRLKVEGMLFRDIYNILLTQSHDRFWGRHFSNPSGYKAKIGISSQFHPRFAANLESSYIKSFQKEGYKEFGAELSFKWCF